VRVGSLFSGIGGLELGLERAGMKTIMRSKSSTNTGPRLTGIATSNPLSENTVKRVSESTSIGSPQSTSSVAASPAKTSPSQEKAKDSQANVQDSGASSRAFGEVKPSWVIIENVPALRSRGLGTVLRDLSSLGYDAEWDCLPASAFGAPHRRDRVFVVAHAQRDAVRNESRRSGGESRKGSAFPGLFGQARPTPVAYLGTSITDLGGSVYGLSNRVDRLRCLGNAVVPQVAEHVGRLILAAA
jgi:DNA (cytosine-5)-methyltransferase 1